MAKSLNLKFEEKFKIATIALRLNQAHPDSPRNLLWLFQFFFFLGVFGSCTYFLTYSIFSHHIKSGEYGEASKNGAMIIVAFNIVYKYIVMIIRQKDIRELIQFVEKDYSDDNNYSDEDMDIVQEYADKGVLVSKLWFAGGIGPCLSFPSKAIVCMIYYYWIGEFRLVQMFDIQLPEPLETYKKNSYIAFWAFFLLTFSFDLYVTTMYIGFDSLVPILMLHICGQLMLLIQRISRIFAFDDSKKIEQELKIIVKKMQSLYIFMDRVKSYFSAIYECKMKTTTCLLSFSAVLIVQDMRNMHKNPEFIIFFAGSIVHFFVPCYYSDLLMEQSENFRLAIYFSGWEKCPNKTVRKIISFMLTKARTPMGIRTIFYDINLDTFAEMCRQAYGIFNVIHAASVK